MSYLFDNQSSVRAYQAEIEKKLSRIKSLVLRTAKTSSISKQIESASIIKKDLNLKINDHNLYKFAETLGTSRINVFRIIFHADFSEGDLPGNLYMPKIKKKAADRASLISQISSQHKSLNPDSIVILITTRDFWQTLQTETRGNLIPLFIKGVIKYPMLARQYMYYHTYNLLRRLFNYNFCTVHQDSDLIPLKNDSIFSNLAISRNCSIFSVRSAPNIMPINGGLYYTPSTDKTPNMHLQIIDIYRQLQEIKEISNILQTNIKIWDGDQLALYRFTDGIDQPSFVHDKSQGNTIFLCPSDLINFPLKDKEDLKTFKRKPIHIHLKGKAKEHLSAEHLSELLK